MEAMQTEENEFIAIFSRKELYKPSESVRLCSCCMSDCVEKLLLLRRDIVINPFCDKNIQMVLPYDFYEKMMIPVMQSISGNSGV